LFNKERFVMIHLIRQPFTLLRAGMLTALLFSSLHGLTSPAHANDDLNAPTKTFTVTTTQDIYDDVQLGDGKCDTLPLAGEQCSLRAALAEAAALPGRERIVVKEGTYKAAPNKAGFTIASCVVIEGAGKSTTLLDGDKRDFALISITATPACDEGVVLRDLALENAGGGGLRVAEGARATVERVTIRNNTFLSFGAGINNAGNLRLVESTVDNNSTGARAGGIANGKTGQLLIQRSTISNNQSTDNRGGGIVNDGALVVEQSTIANNRAKYNGSGLINNGLTFLNGVTVAGNEAAAPIGIGQVEAPETVGGGIVNNGELRMQSSVLAGNTNNRPFIPNDPNIGPDCKGTLISLGFNLLGSPGSPGKCSVIYLDQQLAVTDQKGTLQQPLDAGLQKLEFYGGATHTMLPKPGSPVLDRGPVNAAQCPKTDQRGRPRPFDGDKVGGARCDIGAVEYVYPLLTALSPASVTVGAQNDLKVAVSGVGFSQDTRVAVGYSPVTTTFVSATKLEIVVPAAKLQQVGKLQVGAQDLGTNGQSSVLLTLDVTPLDKAPPPNGTAPVITSLVPGSTVAGAAELTLIVVGTNFANNAAVYWNGAVRPTTFVDSKQLQAKILATDLVNAGQAKVHVESGDPLAKSPEAVFVVKQKQTINFPAMPDQPLSAQQLALNATTSSGLPISYSAAGACSVENGALRLNQVGSCTVVASQSGSDAYGPAVDVVRSFTIFSNALPPAPDGPPAAAQDRLLYLPLLSR
jgi:hypothetical protein